VRPGAGEPFGAPGPRRRAGGVATRTAALPQRRRGNEHQRSERGEQHVRVDSGRQPAADVRAGQAEPGKDEPGPDPHPTGSPVRDHADECGRPDDQQRPRGRGVRRLVEQVDQRRDGEDRPAAAQCAQGQADEQPGRDRDGQHAGIS
jgi:hypothetical protein